MTSPVHTSFTRHVSYQTVYGAGIDQWVLWLGLKAGRSGFRIPAGARDFHLLHNVQNSYGTRLASHLMETGVLSRVQSGAAWGSPLKSKRGRGWQWVELHLHPLIHFNDVDRDYFSFLKLLLSYIKKIYRNFAIIGAFKIIFPTIQIFRDVTTCNIVK